MSNPEGVVVSRRRGLVWNTISDRSVGGGLGLKKESAEWPNMTSRASRTHSSTKSAVQESPCTGTVSESQSHGWRRRFWTAHMLTCQAPMTSPKASRVLTCTVEVRNLGFPHPVETETTTLHAVDLQAALIGTASDLPASSIASVGPFKFEAFWFNRRLLRAIRRDRRVEGRCGTCRSAGPESFSFAMGSECFPTETTRTTGWAWTGRPCGGRATP
jgi:hypothetical protein